MCMWGPTVHKHSSFIAHPACRSEANPHLCTHGHKTRRMLQVLCHLAHMSCKCLANFLPAFPPDAWCWLLVLRPTWSTTPQHAGEQEQSQCDNKTKEISLCYQQPMKGAPGTCHTQPEQPWKWKGQQKNIHRECGKIANSTSTKWPLAVILVQTNENQYKIRSTRQKGTVIEGYNLAEVAFRGLWIH